MPPEVYISIVNWNERDTLKTCLKSIKNTTAYDQFKIIVVDNNSMDGSVEMLRNEFPEVTIIERPRNEGFSKAHNKAFEVAMNRGADYVLLLNNDTVIEDEHWLETLLDIGERYPKIGAIGCQTRYPDGKIQFEQQYYPRDSPFFPSAIQQKYEYNRWETENTDPEFEYMDEVYGAVLLVKCSTIEEVGKLDESYSPLYFEESDYCARIWNAGYRVAYTQETYIIHQENESTRKVNQLWLNYIIHRNFSRFILTYYPPTWLLYSLPILLCNPAIVLLERGKDGDVTIRQDAREAPLHAMYYLLLAYLSVVAMLPDIFKKRRQRTDLQTLLK